MANPKMPCHILIRNVAVNMAHVLYEELMKDNNRYAEYKRMCPELTPEKLQMLFVQNCWPTLIEPARHLLVDLLSKPNIEEVMKERIAEALILDHGIGRGEVKTVVTKH